MSTSSRANNIKKKVHSQKNQDEFLDEIFQIRQSLLNGISQNVGKLSNKSKEIVMAAKLLNSSSSHAISGATHHALGSVAAMATVANKITGATREQETLLREHRQSLVNYEISKGQLRGQHGIYKAGGNMARNIARTAGTIGAGLMINHAMGGGLHPDNPIDPTTGEMIRTGMSPGAKMALSIASPLKTGALLYGGGLTGYGANVLGGIGAGVSKAGAGAQFLGAGGGLSALGGGMTSLAGMAAANPILGAVLTIGALVGTHKTMKALTPGSKETKGKHVRPVNFTRYGEINPVHNSNYSRELTSNMVAQSMGMIDNNTLAIVNAIARGNYNTAYIEDVLNELKLQSELRNTSVNRGANDMDDRVSDGKLSARELDKFKKGGKLNGFQRTIFGLDSFLSYVSEATNFSNIFNTKDISKGIRERNLSMRTGLDKTDSNMAIKWGITTNEVALLHTNISQLLKGSPDQMQVNLLSYIASLTQLSTRKMVELHKETVKNSIGMIGEREAAKEARKKELEGKDNKAVGFVKYLDKMVSDIPVLKLLSVAGHGIDQLTKGIGGVINFAKDIKGNTNSALDYMRSGLLDQFRTGDVANEEQLRKKIGMNELSPEDLAFKYLSGDFIYHMQELLNYTEGIYANVKSISGIDTKQRNLVLDKTTGNLVSQKELKDKYHSMIQELERSISNVEDPEFSLGSWLGRKLTGTRNPTRSDMRRMNEDDYSHITDIRKELGSNIVGVRSHTQDMDQYTKQNQLPSGPGFDMGNFSSSLFGYLDINNNYLNTIQKGIISLIDCCPGNKNSKKKKKKGPYQITFKDTTTDVNDRNQLDKAAKVESSVEDQQRREFENNLYLKGIYESITKSMEQGKVPRSNAEAPKGSTFGLTDILSGLFDFLPDKTKKFVMRYIGKFSKLMKDPRTAAVAVTVLVAAGFAYSMWDDFSSEAEQHYNALKESFSNLGDEVKKLYSGIADKFQEAFDQWIFNLFGIEPNKKYNTPKYREEQTQKIQKEMDRIKAIQDPRERAQAIKDYNANTPEQIDAIKKIQDNDLKYSLVQNQKQFGVDITKIVKNGMDQNDSENINKMSAQDLQQLLKTNTENINATQDQKEKEAGRNLHKQIMDVFQKKREIEIKEKEADSKKTAENISKTFEANQPPVQDNTIVAEAINNSNKSSSAIAGLVAGINDSSAKQFGLVVNEISKIAEKLKGKESHVLDSSVTSMIPSLNSGGVVQSNQTNNNFGGPNGF